MALEVMSSVPRSSGVCSAVLPTHPLIRVGAEAGLDHLSGRTLLLGRCGKATVMFPVVRAALCVCTCACVCVHT